MPSGWGLRPRALVYDMLELHGFTQHSAQMRYFLNNDILTVGSSSPPLSQILVEHLIRQFQFMFYLEELARQKADLSQGHNWNKTENISKPTQLIFET